jgi:hypothetical protein
LNKIGIRVFALVVVLLVIAAGFVQASISSSPDWTQESNQANAQLGVSIRSAGDVNGDGFIDIVVNSDRYDNGDTDEGRVSLYYGTSTGYEASAAWSKESDQYGALYGFSAGAAGDVNGDGYGDLIVGARFWDEGGSSNVGKVYVYHGSSGGLSSTPNWTKTGTNFDDRLGISVGTAGDVNNDGYDDVIVTAQHADNGQTDEGKVYVYHGSNSGLNSTAAWSYESDQDYALLGTSAGTAGDVNNDGYDDVIVGAQWYDNGQDLEGKAFAFYGSSTGLSSSPNWTYENNQSGSLLGYSVGTAGDVNNDGYDDVIVGAYRFDAYADEGRAYVFHGSSGGLSSTPNWTKDGSQVGEWFGYSVAAVGDVNADCYDDVIVGAMAYNNGATNDGKVYIYTGSSSGLNSTAHWTYTGSGGQAVGYFVHNASDQLSTTAVRILVGSPFYSNGQSGEGTGLVFYNLCD